MEEALKLDKYSYQDYLDIDNSTQEMIEFIFGKIYMMAGATALHQDTVGNIFFRLKMASRSKENCLPRVAPFDLKLNVDNKTNVVQPDVMIFCTDSLPCAIFEVLSPSTAYKDKTVKKELYEKSGVVEYFLVNIEYGIVEKFMLVDGKYRYIGAYSFGDSLYIDCLEEDIAVSDIFENIEFAKDSIA